MIRAAVVGVNHIGRIHCENYSKHPDVEFVAVCDLIEDRALNKAKEHGVKAYTDINQMLENEQIDVISVATAGVENGSHHYEPTMAAIEAGVDVLVEKPISNNIEEAREMVRRARDKGVRLATNLNHRFVPAASKGKQLIEQGEVGPLLFINMRLTIDNPKDITPWFHMRALHPHSIDVMRYFAGDVRRVQAFMTKAEGRTSWSTVSINMEFVSGAVGHLTGSYDMSMKHPIEYCEVAGSKGRFVIDNVYENFHFYPRDRDEIISLRNSIFSGIKGFDDTFRNRIGQFISEIKDGVAPDQIECSGADGLAVQEIIEAAIFSQENDGAVVNVFGIKS